MELEKQLCSLELAKKLKELGVKQESFWYWTILPSSPRLCSKFEIEDECSRGLFEVKVFSAFSVAELGELLPKIIVDKYGQQWWLELHNERGYKDEQGRTVKWAHENIWQVAYANVGLVSAETEADSRATMLILLLEGESGECSARGKT